MSPATCNAGAPIRGQHRIMTNTSQCLLPARAAMGRESHRTLLGSFLLREHHTVGKQGGEDRGMILCEANCCEIVVPEDGDAQRHQDVLSLCEESQPYDCCRFV